MNRRVRALTLDDAHHLACRDIHHREGIGGRGTEREARRGVIATGPHIAGLRQLEVARLDQGFGSLESLRPEKGRIALVQGSLESRRANMAVEDTGVRMVEDRSLDAAVH